MLTATAPPAPPTASRTTTRRPLVALVASAAVVVVVFALLPLLPHLLPVDFLVYRGVVPALLHGVDFTQGNLHAPELGPVGMPFTYTPFAAVLFTPTALVPWWAAFVGWTVLSVAVVLVTVLWADGCRRPDDVRARHVVLFLLACSTTVAVQHLVYGQVNLLLMAAVLADVVLPQRLGRLRRPSGVLVGVAAAVKLTPALFIVFFAVTGQWRRLAWSSATFLAAGAIGFAVAPAASTHFWTASVFHLSDRVDLTGSAIASSGNDSITGAVAGLAPGWSATPLVLAVGALGLVAAAVVHRHGRPVDAVLVIGLLAPMLSPISWIHHWVWIFPAAVVALRSLPSHRSRVVAAVVLLALVVPGPSFSDFIHSDVSWAAPLAPLWRESLLLAGAGLVAVLTAAALRRPTPDGSVGTVPHRASRPPR